MAIRVEIPQGDDALAEFVLFHDRVYASRGARWQAMLPFQLPILLGTSPFNVGRTLRPFVARAGGDVVVRAAALVDERYVRHWSERIGHVVLFEALPDTREATRMVLDAACEWLAEQGMEAARAGFGMLEFMFTTDAYEALPPSFMRQNPAYYHALLKDAGFETEKGGVDYKITVRPELVARWESALEAARRGGFEIVPLKDVPESRRVREFNAVWQEAFARHWGISPGTEDEYAEMFAALAPVGVLDTSVLAYRDGRPVGCLWVAPETTFLAATAPGREIRPDEKLNFLGIGVLEPARGRGVNLAMASHAYLELVRRGATHVSYTFVLDDNWPSRRTAEKLGAEVCASYVAYRRSLRR
ncbi:MAG: GNAT family N-acetyltransferase [Thermodesulfobacteriota bacterium]